MVIVFSVLASGRAPREACGRGGRTATLNRMRGQELDARASNTGSGDWPSTAMATLPATRW